MKIEATVIPVGEGKEQKFQLKLGVHVLGDSKTDFDARFHMHAVNQVLQEKDAVIERVQALVAGWRKDAQEIGDPHTTTITEAFAKDVESALKG